MRCEKVKTTNLGSALKKLECQETGKKWLFEGDRFVLFCIPSVL